MCSTITLINLCIFIGVLFSAASVLGICMSLYLIFGDPIKIYAIDTYQPNWEDIGPAIFSSIISLLINVLLVGGSRQHNRHSLLIWIIWKVFLVLIFWAWFGYNHLKYQGYIAGYRGCYFCGLSPEEMAVTFGGILCSVIILFTMLPVIILRGRFNKEHRVRVRGNTPVPHFSDSRQYLAASPPHHYQELTPFQQPKEHSSLDVQKQQLAFFEQQQQQQFQQQLNVSPYAQLPVQTQYTADQVAQIQYQQQLQQMYQQQQLLQYQQQLTPDQYQQLLQQQQQQQQQQQLGQSQQQLYFIQSGQTVAPFTGT